MNFIERYFKDLDKPLAPKLIALGLRVIALFFIFSAIGAIAAFAVQGLWRFAVLALLTLPITVVTSLVIPEMFVALMDLRYESEKTRIEMNRLRRLNEAFAKGQPLPDFKDED
ncbi:MAG: hypothetical protein ACK5LE_05645 [Alphaproteobacteria bacterium]